MRNAISFMTGILISTFIVFIGFIILLFIQQRYQVYHLYELKFFEIAIYHRIYSAFLASKVKFGDYYIPIYDLIYYYFVTKDGLDENLLKSLSNNNELYNYIVSYISYDSLKKAIAEKIEEYKKNGVALGIQILANDTIGYCDGDKYAFPILEKSIIVCQPNIIAPTIIVTNNSK